MSHVSYQSYVIIQTFTAFKRIILLGVKFTFISFFQSCHNIHLYFTNIQLIPRNAHPSIEF